MRSSSKYTRPSASKLESKSTLCHPTTCELESASQAGSANSWEYHVGKTIKPIINHPPVITIFICGIMFTIPRFMGGLWHLFFPRIIKWSARDEENEFGPRITSNPSGVLWMVLALVGLERHQPTGKSPVRMKHGWFFYDFSGKIISGWDCWLGKSAIKTWQF